MDKYTVRDNGGSVDIVASATAYAEALTEWVRNNDFPTEKVESAVEATFDRYDGKPIHVSTLIDLSVGNLITDPAQHSAAVKRITAYVKGQKEIGRLKVKNGPAGGVTRLHRPGENS